MISYVALSTNAVAVRAAHTGCCCHDNHRTSRSQQAIVVYRLSRFECGEVLRTFADSSMLPSHETK